jgi:hypothetical protein
MGRKWKPIIPLYGFFNQVEGLGDDIEARKKIADKWDAQQKRSKRHLKELLKQGYIFPVKKRNQWGMPNSIRSLDISYKAKLVLTYSRHSLWFDGWWAVRIPFSRINKTPQRVLDRCDGTIWARNMRNESVMRYNKGQLDVYIEINEFPKIFKELIDSKIIKEMRHRYYSCSRPKDKKKYPNDWWRMTFSDNGDRSVKGLQISDWGFVYLNNSERS